MSSALSTAGAEYSRFFLGTLLTDASIALMCFPFRNLII
jgi:hypothetical protein